MHTLTRSLINGHAARLQIFGDSIGTSLRQSLVQLGVTLGRCRANHLHVLAGLNRRQRLAGIGGQFRLALCEGHKHEVFHLHFAHDVLTGHFLDHLHFLDDFLRLLGQLVLQLVDASVQGVDFSLVAELGHGEVVRAVRILELVDETGVQLHVGTVQVVFRSTVAEYCKFGSIDTKHFVVQTPRNRGLHVELPSLFRTKVEHEVNRSLRSHVVAMRNLLEGRGNWVDKWTIVCIHNCFRRTEQVSPANSVQADHLEAARLTLVATEPVREVHRSEQARIQEAHKRARRAVGLVREVGVALHGQTEHGRKPASDSQASVRVQPLHPCVARGLRSQTTIDANVEIVKRFALGHGLSLCLSVHCHCSDSKE